MSPWLRGEGNPRGLKTPRRRRDDEVSRARPTVPSRSIVETSLTGAQLLSDPVLNAGTAFTLVERARFGLHGLLPPAVETLDQQCLRAYRAYQRKDNDLERHIFLRALQDANETLFYALLLRHMTEMTPIVYTPVVASASVHFSQIYRRPRGLFLSHPLRDRMDEMLRNRPRPEVDVIVVTDGERTLGIGDQGAGGMAIPIGKLSLYTLIGGLAPWRTLPVLLDVGTNNPDLLRDPEYIGWRHERISERAYREFVEGFVAVIERRLPNVLLQWEDLAKPHARPILDKYRDRLCTFNDDIQGTAAVTLGALYGALRVTGGRLSNQEVVIVGAGGAGTGIAEYILAAMVAEGSPEAQARRRFFLVDQDGLLHTGLKKLSQAQRGFAQPQERVAPWDRSGRGTISLDDVVRSVAATILIGVSSRPGIFSERIVREMARKVERPIIFPLSNPDDRAEAVPRDLIEWTDGRALVVTGSPFAPVSYKGRTIQIGQCNNFYIFPAIGLAVVASGARRVTDKMMLVAARALGDFSPAEREAGLLPPLESIRDVAMRIAVAVAMEAQRSGLATKTSVDRLQRKATQRFWTPAYPAYKRGHEPRRRLPRA
jgi:malate dehydrogenase (oxaloacetate-decarboxylating)